MAASGFDPWLVPLRQYLLAAACAGSIGVTVVAWPADARAAAPDEEVEQQEGVVPSWRDPTIRPMPRTHRFRLGLELFYLRLSAAIDEGTGETQRFHMIPLGLDFAYQAQFLKYVMVRPSLAVAGNVANTMEAMPFIVHPKLFAGYQGRLFGAAFGYGWFTPPVARKDVNSAARGGLGQPILTNNHHVGVEFSVTTRMHPGRGQLSLALYVGGVRSHLQHFDLDKPKDWRPLVMFTAGWFFDETKRGRERRKRREKAREQRRRERDRRRRR